VLKATKIVVFSFRQSGLIGGERALAGTILWRILVLADAIAPILPLPEFACHNSGETLRAD
jgi:hypothetical protein